MARPVNHPKPDLSRLASRQIKFPNTRNALEMELLQWMTDVVRITKQPPEAGVHAETVLMSTAKSSIDVLMQAPTGMAVAGSGKQTVHAEFRWGRFPDGRWYVSAVSLGLNVSAAQQNLARQRALKERLSDQAELENAQHVHLRQTAFPAEDHVGTWTDDILRGDLIIRNAIARAHEQARLDAAALENPVTPVDMALDLASAGVGHITGPQFTGAKKLEELGKELKGEAGGAWRLLTENPIAQAELAHQRAIARQEALELAHKAAELGHKDLELAERLHEKEKSKGDKIMETALDYAIFIPGAGPFVKTIAGMMFDIAIASDAARVTKIRSRFYVWFVAGYIHQLALVDTGGPVRNTANGKVGELWYRWDRKYYDLGINAAPAPNSPRSFPAQASLMHYAMEHYTDGGWGGLGFKARNWKFPDGFIVNWSPELLGRALATQLHKIKYLTG
jgi:hypothetical protein